MFSKKGNDLGNDRRHENETFSWLLLLVMCFFSYTPKKRSVRLSTAVPQIFRSEFVSNYIYTSSKLNTNSLNHIPWEWREHKKVPPTWSVYSSCLMQLLRRRYSPSTSNSRKSFYPIVEEEKNTAKKQLEYDFLSRMNRFDFSGAQIANHVEIYEIKVVPRNRFHVKFGWAIFCHRRRHRCATQIQSSSKDLLVSIMRKWSFRLAIVAIAYPSKPRAIECITWKCKQRSKPFYICYVFFAPFMSMLIYCTVIGSYHTNKKHTQAIDSGTMYFTPKPGWIECIFRAHLLHFTRNWFRLHDAGRGHKHRVNQSAWNRCIFRSCRRFLKFTEAFCSMNCQMHWNIKWLALATPLEPTQSWHFIRFTWIVWVIAVKTPVAKYKI